MGDPLLNIWILGSCIKRKFCNRVTEVSELSGEGTDFCDCRISGCKLASYTATEYANNILQFVVYDITRLQIRILMSCWRLRFFEGVTEKKRERERERERESAFEWPIRIFTCICVRVHVGTHWHYGTVVLTASGGEHTARVESITAKLPARDRSGCESRVPSLSFYEVYFPFFTGSIGILVTGDNLILEFCRVLYGATRG